MASHPKLFTSRRSLLALWLSVVLHSVLIGLTRPPQQASSVQPSELHIQLAQATPPLPIEMPETVISANRIISIPVAQTPSMRAAPLLSPQPALAKATPPEEPNPAPQHAKTLSSEALSSATTSREQPPPQISIPVSIDLTYYKFKELDAEPASNFHPEPVYPPLAKDQKIGGRVLLRLHIEYDGSISQTEIVKVYPEGDIGAQFSQAALDSIKALKFSPAKRHGQIVRARLEFWVLFKPDP